MRLAVTTETRDSRGRQKLGVNMDNKRIVYTEEGAEFSVPAVEITAVTPKSIAAKAGLQKGDLIMEVKGQTIEDRERLISVIGMIEPGEVVPIVFLRDGKQIGVFAAFPQ